MFTRILILVAMLALASCSSSAHADPKRPGRLVIHALGNSHWKGTVVDASGTRTPAWVTTLEGTGVAMVEHVVPPAYFEVESVTVNLPGLGGAFPFRVEPPQVEIPVDGDTHVAIALAQSSDLRTVRAFTPAEVVVVEVGK